LDHRVTASFVASWRQNYVSWIFLLTRLQ